ncbi:YeiH family protein [Poseidonibacter lekithochrous]|uniref:YeiH family protein n=1 Tax=Poseidonibacter TaxID=2321187 RepID=UPI001C095F70|nr:MULTISPECIES: YeiH family protein [Poseidonibacter]MBU3013176.1 YeiH family protein [Poseidonibacter lekithochrous]MDO6826472.1 YeiH family protein [Poseidonibacter sp. 1_MG-2023]
MKIEKNLLYGLLIIGLGTGISILIANIEVIRVLSISPLIIAIFLGAILTHILNQKTMDYLESAIGFSTKRVLRFGIILYGFRLTLQNLEEVGLEGFIFAVFIVASTFIIGYFIGTKILKMDKEITILTSIGSSICGAAAVLATESVIKTPAYKSAVAVSTVVIFGTFAMLLYPFLYKLGIFDLSPQDFGIYLGGTLHEVAHVVAAGNAVDNEVASYAVIEKMIRVMMLAPFLIILGFFWIKKETNKIKQKVVIPWFAVLFCVVIVFNSFEFISAENIILINDFDTFLLAMAMFALGLQTHISKFKKVGAKPFYLASILFIWLIVGGLNGLEFIVNVMH